MSFIITICRGLLKRLKLKMSQAPKLSKGEAISQSFSDKWPIDIAKTFEFLYHLMVISILVSKSRT